MSKKYLIIGASAAGINAAMTIRRHDQTGEISIVTSESGMPYNKCLLAKYAAGSINNLDLISSELLTKHRISLVNQHTIAAINVQDKSTTTSDNEKLWYDRLLIATGTRPNRLSCAGLTPLTKGFFTWHTKSDIEAIEGYIKNETVKRVLVIGAGINGLECADALARRSLNVIIIEQSNSILFYDSTDSIAIALKSRLHPTISLICQARIQEVVTHNNKIIGTMVDGTLIAADMIIGAMGVQLNSGLAHAAGLSLKEGHIWVNEYMQTNDPSIFAGGDVAITNQQSPSYRSYLWADAIDQGIHAGFAMVERGKPYKQSLPMIVSTLASIVYAHVGTRTTEYTQKKNDQAIMKIYTSDNVITGFSVVANDVSLVGKLRTCIGLSIEASTIKDILNY